MNLGSFEIDGKEIEAKPTYKGAERDIGIL